MLTGIDSVEHCTLLDEEAGKYANLIDLSENPVENIETIQMPQAVYKKGSLVL